MKSKKNKSKITYTQAQAKGVVKAVAEMTVARVIEDVIKTYRMAVYDVMFTDESDNSKLLEIDKRFEQYCEDFKDEEFKINELRSYDAQTTKKAIIAAQ